MVVKMVVMCLLLFVLRAQAAISAVNVSYTMHNFTTRVVAAANVHQIALLYSAWMESLNSSVIDHFNYRNNATYQMRYAVSDEYWKPYEGPIFFYTGNEQPVEAFVINTGLIWQWAPDFGALLVFAEHRYYGKSLPFGNESFKDPEHSGFLTSEQALADYADLILWLKKTLPGANESKVVSFGGSYGGVLSTFLRMKYPHVVDAHAEAALTEEPGMVAGYSLAAPVKLLIANVSLAAHHPAAINFLAPCDGAPFFYCLLDRALASSAPFKMFPGLTPCETYFSAITAAFEKSSPGCPDIISDSWPILDKYGSTVDGCKTLEETFHTCLPLFPSDYKIFKDWVRDKYTYLALVNYPYDSELIGNVPAYPVKVACSCLLNKSDSTDESMLNAVAEAMNVNNSTGRKICNDLYKATNQEGWRYQACTELVQPVCGDGVRDMFYPVEWNPQEFSLRCQDRFGVTPDFKKMMETYPIPNLQTASKIFFSNGDLDPWTAYGLTAAPTPQTKYLLIEGAAHHTDLQLARQGEPSSFAAARQAEKKAIRKWIS